MSELVTNIGYAGEIVLLESVKTDIKVTIRSMSYISDDCDDCEAVFKNCRRVSLMGNLLVLTMDSCKHFAMPLEKIDCFYYE
jgi:hypothetical protein